jgi:hypothetical protein
MAVLISRLANPCTQDIRFARAELRSRCAELIASKNIAWDQETAEFEGLSQASTGEQEHHDLLCRLLARLRDGHAEVQLRATTRAVRPLDDVGEGRTGPGMFWCRIGGRIHVKQSWFAARDAGIEPGMEVLEVDGVEASAWIDRRIAELAAWRGFGTPQHAFFYACHCGLVDREGAIRELLLRAPSGEAKRLAVRYQRASPYPWGPAFFPGRVARLKTLHFGRTGRGFGYIHLFSCSRATLSELDQALEEIAGVQGLVLDLRGNPGGFFQQESFLGRFVPAGQVLEGPRLFPSAGARPFGGAVVAIASATTRSAAEVLCGALKESGRAYVLGESATAGMSSHKHVIELPSGLFALRVSTRTREPLFSGGRGIEGVGIEPDELCEFNPADLARRSDTLIHRAEDLLVSHRLGQPRFAPSRPRAPAPAEDKAFGR